MYSQQSLHLNVTSKFLSLLQSSLRRAEGESSQFGESKPSLLLTKCIVDLVLGIACLEASTTAVCLVVGVCAQQMSTDYTKMSTDYTKMSTDYTKMSTDYTKMSTNYTKMSTDYTKMSTDYTKMSTDVYSIIAYHCYLPY